MTDEMIDILNKDGHISLNWFRDNFCRSSGIPKSFFNERILPKIHITKIRNCNVIAKDDLLSFVNDPSMD